MALYINNPYEENNNHLCENFSLSTMHIWNLVIKWFLGIFVPGFERGE